MTEVEDLEVDQFWFVDHAYKVQWLQTHGSQMTEARLACGSTTPVTVTSTSSLTAKINTFTVY